MIMIMILRIIIIHDYDDHAPAPPSACLVSHLTYSSLTVTNFMMIIMNDDDYGKDDHTDDHDNDVLCLITPTHH